MGEICRFHTNMLRTVGDRLMGNGKTELFGTKEAVKKEAKNSHSVRHSSNQLAQNEATYLLTSYIHNYKLQTRIIKMNSKQSKQTN